jgi:DNA-directed RNA polymerase subunit M/transcription elongation factor TFIIS
MNHALREYARGKLATALGAGAIGRNAEISILNWAVKTTKGLGHEASWESLEFRRRYKLKLLWLLKEMERETKVFTTLGVEGDRVTFQYTVLPQLVGRLRRKELDVKNIANYSADVLWPAGPYSQTMFKLREKDMAMEAAKAKEEDYEGLFKCGKCKSTKTTYYQMQTRSADEPMVRFVIALLLATFY